MKQIITTALLVFIGCGAVKAQDPEFSQFYSNPMYLNPAMAGSAGGPRFALNYRNQWPNVSGSFTTYSASYDEFFDGISGGAGAQVWYDQAGDGKLSTTYFSGYYAYQLDISGRNSRRNYKILKFGLQASAFRRSIDFSRLTWEDQIDRRLGFIYPTNEKLPANGVFQTNITPDFSAGMMAFTKKFYGGVAVHHIVRPSQSFFGNPNSTLPTKLTVHGGMLIPVGSKNFVGTDGLANKGTTYISPNLLFMMQGRFAQINAGAYVMRDAYMGGISYRQTFPNEDAIILMVGFRKDAVRIGYSYDLTVSGARSAAVGSHEVSLIIEANKASRKNKKKWKPLLCPSSF